MELLSSERGAVHCHVGEFSPGCFPYGVFLSVMSSHGAYALSGKLGAARKIDYCLALTQVIHSLDRDL